MSDSSEEDGPHLEGEDERGRGRRAILARRSKLMAATLVGAAAASACTAEEPKKHHGCLSVEPVEPDEPGACLSLWYGDGDGDGGAGGAVNLGGAGGSTPCLSVK